MPARGASLREQAASEYNWDDVTDGYEELAQRLAAGQSRRTRWAANGGPCGRRHGPIPTAAHEAFGQPIDSLMVLVSPQSTNRGGMNDGTAIAPSSTPHSPGPLAPMTTRIATYHDAVAHPLPPRRRRRAPAPTAASSTVHSVGASPRQRSCWAGHPNQVTVISGMFTFTGIALIALPRPSALTATLVVLALVIGYASMPPTVNSPG